LSRIWLFKKRSTRAAFCQFDAAAVIGLLAKRMLPAIQLNLYVPALVGGVFGTKAWIARLATRSGVTGSAAAVRPRAIKIRETSKGCARLRAWAF
jgi:hypothetical protein